MMKMQAFRYLVTLVVGFFLRFMIQPNVETQSPDGLESLRYAAFGTSRTWGSGLEDPQTQVSWIRHIVVLRLTRTA